MDNSHTNKMIIFENQHIRSIEKEGGTWFSVSDVIGVLTESKDPKAYWRQLKKREEQLVTICHGLKLMSNDGKKRLEDCANTEGVLRIIQSVPSPKAEPFKLWLAQVGAQVLEETTQPELSFERLRELYRAKGYSDEWIVSRLKSIGIRKELTDEWKKRGVAEGSEYAHLTAEISRATFSMNPSEYKDFKQLPEKENLRDHMSNLELIFTMLGEEMTRKIAVDDDAQGFNENKDAAKRGGQIAGDARERVETNSGYKVISSDNFLKQIQAVSDEEADKDANKTEK